MTQAKATLDAQGYTRTERRALRAQLAKLHERADAAWRRGEPIVVLTFADFLDLSFPADRPHDTRAALKLQRLREGWDE